MTDAPRITPLSWALVALLGLTWGATFPVTEVALTGITPYWLAASRIVLGAALTFVFWQAMGGRLFVARPTTAALINLTIIGAISSTVPFILLAWGQQFVTAGFAGVSMASVALIVLPLAHFFVPGERMSLRRTAGFVIGFVGVAVLIGGSAFEATGAALELPGRIACVGAASCYAVGSILLRRLPAVDPVGLACVLLIIGAVLIVPVAWAVEGPPPLPDAQTLGVLAFLGLVPTAIASVLRVYVVRTAGPVFMSLVNYQVPVWSVMIGALALAEPLPPQLWWALALILSGVALSQWGALRRLFGSGG
ncbi:MAG: DMT family transporter [Pseudomonadota bacterium]